MLDVLRGSPHEPPLLEFVAAAGEILADNKMPFFPAFTDHGSGHVASVLEAALELIPGELWDRERLGPADAAVLVGAAYLHDLALHTREKGFIALVAGDTSHKPLPWYSSRQRGRPADPPWVDLWQAFRGEARHFNQSRLQRLLGPGSEGIPAIAYGDNDLADDGWEKEDYLLVGEFLRRHHARLAHEIAMFGFPGTDPTEFPVLAETLAELADPIGATARSHNEDLRSASEYLHYRERGSMLPDGAAVLYLMGVLRIADFFQLQATRASPLLLHLRDPQSPQSIEEWQKHQVVTGMSFAQDDPLAVFVRVTPPDNLRTHLQVKELIDDLQRELDQTNAVISERYGGSRFDDLRLNCLRIRTNIDEPGLLDRLSFVPARAALRSAEDLFRLVIGDLYGNQPAIAGRELLQNAVDAVRELGYWESRRGTLPDVDFRQLPADVLVEVEEVDDERNVLRITDRGIGMTPETVIEGFLTAGATSSADRERIDAIDASTAARWMKTGKFGVGVFAAFLLGREVHVKTRHVSAQRGVSFVANLNDDLVQLDWVGGLPVGTEITIPFSAAKLTGGVYEGHQSHGDRCRLLIQQVASFYGMAEPSLVYRFVNRHGAVAERPAKGTVPNPGRSLPDDWRDAPAAGFDAVLWRLPLRPPNFKARVARRGTVVHNGIEIKDLDGPEQAFLYRWSNSRARRAIDPPELAVFDSRHLLEVSLNRYRLAQAELTFEDPLLESIGSDVVAHALVCGPRKHPLGRGGYLMPVFARDSWVPLLPTLSGPLYKGDLCVLWEVGLGGAARGAFVEPSDGDERWRHFPQRLVAPMNIVARTGDAEREAALWGFAAEDARVSMAEMRQWLGWDLVAGAMVRRGEGWPLPHPSRGLRTGFWTARSDEEDDEEVYVVGSEPSSGWPPDRGALDDGLVQAAGQIIDDASLRAVAMAVFRRPLGQSAPPGDPVTRRWLEAMGRDVPRDPVAAERMKAEVARGDEALAAAVERWERIAALRRAED